MKFTLKCVLDEYDNFTGDVVGTSDVITHEFREVGLEEVLEKIELFLLGVGFKFDGNLQIVNDEEPLFNLNESNDAWSFNIHESWEKENSGLMSEIKIDDEVLEKTMDSIILKDNGKM